MRHLMMIYKDREPVPVPAPAAGADVEAGVTRTDQRRIRWPAARLPPTASRPPMFCVAKRTSPSTASRGRRRGASIQ